MRTHLGIILNYLPNVAINFNLHYLPTAVYSIMRAIAIRNFGYFVTIRLLADELSRGVDILIFFF